MRFNGKDLTRLRILAAVVAVIIGTGSIAGFILWNVIHPLVWARVEPEVAAMIDGGTGPMLTEIRSMRRDDERFRTEVTKQINEMQKTLAVLEERTRPK